MTVFFSLLLISFLLVLNVCVEGIYAWKAKGIFSQQQEMTGEYALACYHKELWKQFHLLAIDGRYYKKMEASLKTNWTRNGNPPLTTLLIQPGEKLNNTEVLKHEIREYMKYKETADILSSLKQALSGVEEESQSKKQGEVIGKVKTDTDKKSEDAKVDTSEEYQQVEDPRKGLSKLLSGNILKLVLPSGHDLSKKQISIVYGTKSSEASGKINFFHPKSVEDAMKENKKNSATNNLSTEGLAVAYAADVFSTAVDPSREDGIHYEMEYLIGGKDRDDKNLETVVNKLLIIRFCLNYGYIIKDTGKNAQAEALAAAIAGPIASVPGVVSGIRLLLLAAWSYGEAVVDVRGLLAGKKIALTKSDETWQLSLSNLAKLEGTAKSVKNGIGYKEYLEILLLLQVKKDEKYKRMMDLISLRIQETQKDFTLLDSLFSFSIQFEEKVSALLMGDGYEFSATRTFSY